MQRLHSLDMRIEMPIPQMKPEAELGHDHRSEGYDSASHQVTALLALWINTNQVAAQ